MTRWRSAALLGLALAAAPALRAQQPDSAGVYDLAEVDVPPRPTNVAALRRELERRYPPDLRVAAVGGTVQVSFVVSEEGRVEDVLVVRTSDLRFNVPTVEVIGVLRFRPGQVGGRPVRTRVELPIQWNVIREPAPEPERTRRRPRLSEPER